MVASADSTTVIWIIDVLGLRSDLPDLFFYYTSYRDRQANQPIFVHWAVFFTGQWLPP